MKVKFTLFTLQLLLLSVFTSAQITIGGESPAHPAAVVDLQSNEERGLLLPRLAMTADETV